MPEANRSREIIMAEGKLERGASSVCGGRGVAAGYSGTYVIDGGGVVLMRGIPPEPKPYEWLEVHTE